MSRKDGMTIQSAQADPVAFDRILRDPAFAELEAYPHTGAFGRAYHPAIHGNHDWSFVVRVNGVAALICLCAPLDGTLGFYGMPIRLIPRRALDDETRRTSVKSAFLQLDEIAEANNLHEVLVLGDREGALSVIDQACLIRGAALSQLPVARVDLTAGHAAWRSALRKSSRALINWGRRNLSIEYVNEDTPDRTLFDRYRAFHAEVAGRITRPEESWAVMYEWIARGEGELILAFLEGKLIAASMFIDGSETSIYASGVYDRTQFDKPLAHYPLWLGIERACARGMKTLELGDVPLRGTVPEKEFQIGYFKRGFATHTDEFNVYRWLPSLASG